MTGMATAYFCNTTFVRMSVNLNDQLQNQLLDAATENDSFVMPSWPCAVAANAAQGVFGANGNSNLLVVFGSPVGGRPIIYEIRYSGGATLDLYFYVLGDIIVGVDQTGDASKMTVTRISDERARAIRRAIARTA